jgi:hypothetical protein
MLGKALTAELCIILPLILLLLHNVLRIHTSKITDPRFWQHRPLPLEESMAAMDRECQCKRQGVLCGHIMGIALARVAQCPTDLRPLHGREISDVMRNWCLVGNAHCRNDAESAKKFFCELPLRALPRLRTDCVDTKLNRGRNGKLYSLTHCLNDVTTRHIVAIRKVRSSAIKRNKPDADAKRRWKALRKRLTEYERTGEGTVAEAVVTNAHWFKGELPLYVPPGMQTLTIT